MTITLMLFLLSYSTCVVPSAAGTHSIGSNGSPGLGAVERAFSAQLIEGRLSEVDSVVSLDCAVTFHRLLLREPPTETLYLFHIKIADMFENSAEGTELIREAFSEYFIKHMPQSLKVLSGFEDTAMIQKLVLSATFLQGSGNRILQFIEANDLTRQPYYRLFVPFRRKPKE